MELAAIEEATKLLNEFGDSNTKILKTQFPGIIKAETILELLELVEKFRNKIENEPWELRYCSRIIQPGMGPGFTSIIRSINTISMGSHNWTNTRFTHSSVNNVRI